MYCKFRQLSAVLWSAVMISGLASGAARGAIYSWNSAAGGNWTDTSASGWNTGGSYPSVAGDVVTISQNITANATIILDANVSVGSLTLTDAGTQNYNWTIQTSDAAANKLTFDNGASAATLSSTSSSTTGSHEIAAPVVLNSNLNVSVTGTGTNKQLTISGPISGSGGITVNAASTGVLVLSSANTYTGTTTINAATSGNTTSALRLTNSGALANSALVLNGNNGAGGGGAVLQLRSDVDNTTFATTSTTIGGNVTVNVDQLTAGNTGKTLKLGAVTVSDVNANLNLYVTGANGYALSVGDITLGSTTGKRLAILANSANVTVANVTSLAPTNITDQFQLDGTGTGVVTGVISNGSAGGKVSLTKTNTSTWTLSSANTFTGGTSILNGVLKLADGSALQSSVVSVGVANGLAFADGINTFTLGNLMGAGNFSLTNTSGNAIELQVGNDNGSNSSAYTGVMSGSGSLTKVGPGQFLIGGASSNTYTGATTLNGGSIKLAASNALPIGTSLILNAGLVDLNGLNQTVDQLSGSGGNIRNNATNTTSTFTVTGTSTFDGLISDGNASTKKVALVKSTGGTLTLTGANTYTGGTTVSGGTLLVNNTTGSGLGSGGVTVAGTLGGSGRIAMTGSNNVTISSGGTLAPGNSPGILTIAGAQTGAATAGNATLNFVSGSTFSVQLNGVNAGTGYDMVDLIGNADLGTATLDVSLGMTLDADQVFTILRNDGSDAVLNTFADLAQDAVISGITSNGYCLKISYTGEGGAITGGNDVVLYTATAAIPEPAAIGILSLGLSGMLMTWGKRRRV